MGETKNPSKLKTSYKNWPNDAGFEASATCPTPVELKVIGTFPPQVAGTLYRTGPGHYKVDTVKGEYARSHWFDGFTQLHRFQIVPDATTGDFRVYYTSRGQVDELLEQARKGGNLDGLITFGQKRDPCMSLFEKVKSVFQPPDPPRESPSMWNVGVTVAPNMPGMPANVLTSLTDSNQIQHADMDTLEPVGVTIQTSLHPDLKGPLSCAHAQHDPATGDIYNFNLDFGRHATYRIFRTSAATSQTSILATITGPDVKPAYMHSFFLSEDFVIFCVWPSYFRACGASILWTRNIADAMRFDPRAETMWYVIDRKGERGVVARFRSRAFFSFHTVNAYQEVNSNHQDNNNEGTVDVFCDIVQYPDDEPIRGLYYESVLSTGAGRKLRDVARSRLVRYKLGGVPSKGKQKVLGKGKGKGKGRIPEAEVIVEVKGAGELPTINPLYVMKKQRYVYGTVTRGYSSFVDGLGKVDLETGETTYWGMEPKPHTPGEAIFIPDGTGESEDAGYLLTVVLDGEKGTSYLLCLDARDMTEIARAEHDQAIALILHGNFTAATRV